jgi:hypothetical protein
MFGEIWPAVSQVVIGAIGLKLCFGAWRRSQGPQGLIFFIIFVGGGLFSLVLIAGGVMGFIDPPEPVPVKVAPIQVPGNSPYVAPATPAAPAAPNPYAPAKP